MSSVGGALPTHMHDSIQQGNVQKETPKPIVQHYHAPRFNTFFSSAFACSSFSRLDCAVRIFSST
jgi:hypothetical protein